MNECLLAPVTREFIKIIVLVCFGGGLGGLLYWTSLYLVSVESSDDSPQGFRTTKGFLFAQIFMGMGGSWAVLLAMLWGRRAPTASSIEDILQLFATSLVAGFAGSRLLPMVADQLTRQILKDAERKTAKNASRAARSELTSEVYAYLDEKGSKSSHQTLNYQKRLKAEIKRNPMNRSAAILLARLYDELQENPKDAIATLEAFILSKTVDGGTHDEDVADAYWNIANYYERLYTMSGSRDRKMRSAAIEAVASSIRIVPGYLKNVLEDEDFSDLRADEEAKKKLPALIA